MAGHLSISPDRSRAIAALTRAGVAVEISLPGGEVLATAAESATSTTSTASRAASLAATCCSTTRTTTCRSAPRTPSRLAPIDNTLVLFPSDSYHEITKVAPASGETLPFGDGRFTVNGWIHETKLAPRCRRSSGPEAASPRPSISAPAEKCPPTPA